MTDITQWRIYEVRGQLHDRIGSDDLRHRIRAMRGLAMPPAPLPPEALQVLEALKPKQPTVPKVFEGEDEWQKYLKENNLTESDANYRQLSAA